MTVDNDHIYAFGTVHKIFIRTKSGYALTDRQEVFCWRYALHGNGMRAHREAYEGSSAKSHNVNSSKMKKNPKVVERILELKKAHDAGELDLREGPWSHYGKKLKVGAPEKDVESDRLTLSELAKA